MAGSRSICERRGGPNFGPRKGKEKDVFLPMFAAVLPIAKVCTSKFVKHSCHFPLCHSNIGNGTALAHPDACLHIQVNKEATNS